MAALPMVLLLLLLLGASADDQQLHRRLTAAGRGSVGGFSRPSVPSRPASTYKPSAAAAPRAAAPPKPLPGGFTGYARPGFSPTPLLLPFTAGMLAASSYHALTRSPSSYCNGNTVVCYLSACQDALRARCPQAAAANNNTLIRSTCPTSSYTECWKTPDTNSSSTAAFECFGTPRPRFGTDDLSAVCHDRNSATSSTSASRLQVMLMALGLIAAVAVMQ